MERSRHGFGIEALEARTLLAAVTWDGGGDGVSLGDPLNWSTDQIPGAADDATINVPGEPVITAASGSFTFHSLTSFETVDLGSGGLFTLTLLADSVFKADAHLRGEIAGAGKVTFQAHTIWDGLTFKANGRAIVGPDASVVIADTVHLGRRLDNLGFIQVSRPLVVTLGAHVQVNNLPGGVLAISASLSASGAIAVLNNAGTLTSGKIGKPVLIFHFQILSSGAIVVSAGRLQLDIGPVTISGEVFIGPKGTLLTTSGVQFAPSSRVRGPGELLVEEDAQCDGTIDHLGRLTLVSANLELNGPVTVDNLGMEGGTLSGTADIFVLGHLSWIGVGAMTGSGRTIVAKGAQAHLQFDGISQLNRRLVINGAAEFIGDMSLDGGVLEVGTGAELTFTAPDFGFVQLFGEGAGGTLLNKGSIVLSGPPNALLALKPDGADMRFTNNGTLDVGVAKAFFLGSVTQVSGTTLTGGAWIVGGQLKIGANIRTNKATVTLQGEGAFFDALSGLTKNQGSLTIRTSAALAIQPLAGQFTNTGTLTVGLGSVLLVAGGYTQLAQGTTVIRISGTTGDDFGRIVATGAASLAGAARFEFVNGFAPTGGEKFIFLTAASRTGTFGSVSSLGLPVGLKIALVHFNKGVRMDVLPA